MWVGVCSSIGAETGNEYFLFTNRRVGLVNKILRLYGLKTITHIYGRPVKLLQIPFHPAVPMLIRLREERKKVRERKGERERERDVRSGVKAQFADEKSENCRM